jgi:hypothetical protein
MGQRASASADDRVAQELQSELEELERRVVAFNGKLFAAAAKRRSIPTMHLRIVMDAHVDTTVTPFEGGPSLVPLHSAVM